MRTRADNGHVIFIEAVFIKHHGMNKKYNIKYDISNQKDYKEALKNQNFFR